MNKSLKLLFITKYFLPLTGGGLRRIEALYNLFLKNKKIDLTVVTAIEQKDKEFLNVKYVKQLFFKDNKNNCSVDFKNSKSKIKLFDKAFIGWMPNVIFKIIFKQYDCIYATCPVFTNLIIGFLYKILRFNKPKLIVEYRDLFGYNPSYHDNLSKKIIKYVEKIILKSADHIITTTEGMRYILGNIINKEKITVIKNYMSLGDSKKINKLKKTGLNKKYYNIGYIGKLNTGRNPEQFIKLTNLKIKNKPVSLHFVGVNEAEKKYISDILLKNKLKSERVFFYDQVDRLTSLKFMKDCDGLLLLINNVIKISEGYGVPGKLYDYVMINNNIFSDNETIKNLSSEFKIKKISTLGSFINFKVEINDYLDTHINKFLESFAYEK